MSLIIQTQNLQSLAEALFNSCSQPILLLNKEGVIVSINDATVDFFEYPKSDLCLLSVEKIIPQRFHSLIHELQKKVLPLKKLEYGRNENFFVTDKSGNELQVVLKLSAITLENESLIILTIHHEIIDIAEKIIKHKLTHSQKDQTDPLVIEVYKNELELQNNELVKAQTLTELTLIKFKDLYDNAPVGYLTINRNGIILEVNLMVACILGVETNDLVGTAFQNYIVNQRLFINHINKTFNQNKNVVDEFELARKRGNQTQYIQLESQPPNENLDPGTNSFRAIVTDITSQKNLQKELIEHKVQSEKILQKEVASLTASAIAHEINQPLTVISAYAETVVSILNKADPNLEALKQALITSANQAQLAGNKLHELLEFLHTGKLDLEKCDISEIIKESLAILNNDRSNECPNILVEAPQALPLAYANVTHIKKILLNLFNNSIDAMHDLEPQDRYLKILISYLAKEQKIEVEVSDNGKGIPASQQKKLFKAFFTTKTHGIGMGLAISKSLIEAQGGKFWFQSAAHGATFKFTVPVATTSAAKA